jgi:hypothetical protein
MNWYKRAQVEAFSPGDQLRIRPGASIQSPMLQMAKNISVTGYDDRGNVTIQFDGRTINVLPEIATQTFEKVA